jgi:hypothetical protein
MPSQTGNALSLLYSFWPEDVNIPVVLEGPGLTRVVQESSPGSEKE